MAFGYPALLKETIATTTTKYVGVPIRNGRLGAQIAWKDAVAAATITLEFTSFGADDAPVDEAGSAWEWKDSGLTITGPTAAAAGSTLVNVDNVHQRRARFKIVTTAASPMEVRDGGV